MAKQKCEVCGNKLWVGIIGGNVGGRCRICGRLCCSKHFKDGLCPYCWEKREGKKWKK